MRFPPYFIIVLLLSLSIKAQEGIPVFQDYLTSSWYILHPGYAGAALSDQIRITGRTQWFDVNDAPTLFTASYNGRLNKKVGVGGIAFSDTNGNFSQSGFYGTFAYHLNLSHRDAQLNQLSFGLNLQILQRRVDERRLTNPNLIDPAIQGQVINDTSFNSDFGISYFKQNFFVSTTLKNILPVNRDNLLLDGGIEPNNQTRLVITAGNTFPILNTPYSIEPSINYTSILNIGDQQVDFNLKGYYDMREDFRLWLGASFRANIDGVEFTTDTLNTSTQRSRLGSGFIGFNYANFIFAYTYTSQFNDVNFASGGFHQVTLGYNIPDKNNLRNGRRACNCPGFQ